MSEIYTLYGSYASYYTAKVRAYLRKKGVPFVERLPSDPMFRNKVRPMSGSHRIPQLLTPSGEVIQDSVAIVDHLEPRFPDLPAFPETPRQRVFVHLMELLGSEGLVRLAWLHRWLFPENERFVKMDFGRSFQPQGDDETLLKYGSLIADRMMSYGLPASTPELRKALDDQYVELLIRFEQHLTDHPYLLGAHPSAADYALMGALHAHMGRDPAGLRVLQNHAPRTFRWVEHMLVPEVQAPEFFDRPVSYEPGDGVPQTALAILRYVADEWGQPFVLGAWAFDQAMQRRGAKTGDLVDAEADQPVLSVETVEIDGTVYEHATNVHAEWLGQRARSFYLALDGSARDKVDDMLGEGVLRALLNAPLNYRLTRVENRLTIA